MFPRQAREEVIIDLRRFDVMLATKPLRAFTTVEEVPFLTKPEEDRRSRVA